MQATETALEGSDNLPPPLPAGYPLAPGYAIIDHLNRGEALDVYEVFSTERMCSCVAKVVRPDRLHTQRVVDRLLREGRILSTLAHPHLVRGLETLTDPQPIVILETVPGPPLDYLIYERARRLSVHDIAYFGIHLCSAVHYLHGRGYLHLDIRPNNIITQCGIAKLVDLSLARPPGRAARGMGTRSYLAPEQATGDDLTPATDVWGIGATLYEAAAGIPPFAPADDQDEAIWTDDGFLQLHRPAAPLRQWRRRLPEAFSQTIEACLTPDPAARPSVVQLADTLGTLVEEQDASPQDTDGPP